MNYRMGLAKNHISPGSFWHTKQLCHIFTLVDQLSCSILHKNGPTTYNEHFTAYNIMTLVCAGWLHEVQWVLDSFLKHEYDWCVCFMNVPVFFEAVFHVTTVPSNLHHQEASGCPIRDHSKKKKRKLHVSVLNLKNLTHQSDEADIVRTEGKGNRLQRTETIQVISDCDFF